MTLGTLICDSIRRNSDFVGINFLKCGVSEFFILQNFTFLQKCYNQKL